MNAIRFYLAWAERIADGVNRGADASDDLLASPLEAELCHRLFDQVLATAEQRVGLDPADNRLDVVAGELVDLAPRVDVGARAATWGGGWRRRSRAADVAGCAGVGLPSAATAAWYAASALSISR